MSVVTAIVGQDLWSKPIKTIDVFDHKVQISLGLIVSSLLCRRRKLISLLFSSFVHPALASSIKQLQTSVSY